MAKPGTSKELKTLVAAGKWVWDNRDRIRAALQSESVQQALKSPQAQRVMASPALRRVIEHPQVRIVVSSPELQRWINGGGVGPAPSTQPATVIPGEYEPYTGETRRLG